MSVSIQDIKLQTIDFDWIKSTTKISHLKRAIFIIQQDGNFYSELKDACYQRMQYIDPSQKRIAFNNTLTPELKDQITNQLSQWENQVGSKQVKDAKQKDKDLNFDDMEKYFDNQDQNNQKRKVERAEKQRVKGNQAITSKDFDQAVSYYTKAIELDSNMYQAYSNRALAYFKKKDLQKCIQDCDKAIAIQATYAKAYYRKAKALIGLKRRVQGYKCYKQILKIEPENGEVNKEMMQLRQQMTEQQIRELESHLIPKSQFKKITIEEQDSDQQIQER